MKPLIPYPPQDLEASESPSVVDIHQELDDLCGDIERLTASNDALRAENAALRAQLAQARHKLLDAMIALKSAAHPETETPDEARGMKCAHCDVNEATCIGRYDNMEEALPACDECCGHGCEDGHCEPTAAPESPEGENR